MGLTDVKGVGPSTEGKLEASGVETVEELAEIDLRRSSIDGLSCRHVSKLRDHARRLLEARRSSELTLVDGLGRSAAEKLNASGVKTIEQLVDLDLRSEEVAGLSTRHLQRLKRRAARTRGL